MAMEMPLQTSAGGKRGVVRVWQSGEQKRRLNPPLEVLVQPSYREMAGFLDAMTRQFLTKTTPLDKSRDVRSGDTRVVVHEIT